MGKYYGLWVMWERDKTIFLPPSLPRIGLRMDFENQDFVLILHKHKWGVLSKEVTSMEIFTFFQWFQLPTILLFIGSLVTQLSLLVFIQCCGALALNKLKFLIFKDDFKNNFEILHFVRTYAVFCPKRIRRYWWGVCVISYHLAKTLCH